MDLRDEEHFRDCLTLVTGALVWMEEEGEILVTISSADLLQASEPVDEEAARGIWN